VDQGAGGDAAQRLAQQKSLTMARARGAVGRRTSSLVSLGMIVMVQRWVGLLSSNDRAWPVTVDRRDRRLDDL